MPRQHFGMLRFPRVLLPFFHTLLARTLDNWPYLVVIINVKGLSLVSASASHDMYGGFMRKDAQSCR